MSIKHEEDKYKEDNKKEFFYRTYSGIYIDLNNPLSQQIQIEDIAHHLSNNNRWLGASSLPISIAAHSLIVMHVTGELLRVKGFIHCDKEMYYYKLLALLHDAPEAYLGDITNPLKRLLRLHTSIYDNLEENSPSLFLNDTPYHLVVFQMRLR